MGTSKVAQSEIEHVLEMMNQTERGQVLKQCWRNEYRLPARDLTLDLPHKMKSSESE